MPEFFDTSIEYLKGVGPQRAELLKKELAIFNFYDLINHLPFRHIDRTQFYKISDINEEMPYVQIKGRITQKRLIGTGRKQRLSAIISDGTGEIELVWFRGIKWVEKSIQQNVEYIVFGKPTLFNKKYNVAHPEIELYTEDNVKKGFLQPVYHTTENLKKHRIDSKVIFNIQKNLLEAAKNKINENLSRQIVSNYKLMHRAEALQNIHIPTTHTLLNKAILRLKFEESFFIQLKLQKQRSTRRENFKGAVLKDLTLFNSFFNDHLPFELTNAQQRVIKEIYHDLCSAKQMNRLLQGDVGSGKTIVAFLCMLMAIGNNSQACLMAPTEILAEQHYQGLKEFADLIGLRIALLTGSTKTSDRKVIHQMLLSGDLNILIGTHALIEDKVQFKDLTLAVVDEQHRFGVAQRAKLWNKGKTVVPHVLVMTATPIPRTLAMTFYGDLDISVIDELPKGRKPIQTVHRFENKRLVVFDFIRKQVKEGRQIYIVYPMIKESEKIDLNNLTEGFESISRAFPEYKVSIVHGKMKPADKEFEMQRFAKKETQIMVATTVIEVGINIPNATVMIIENSERFGLSQLHQLRGRVGRGAEQSYCILMTDYKMSKESKVRIETMCRTNNGFEISEVDLKLRGPGDLTGTQQSGILDLKITDLNKDGDLIKECRTAAIEVLEKDPYLSSDENKVMLEQLKKSNKGMDWGRVS